MHYTTSVSVVLVVVYLLLVHNTSYALVLQHESTHWMHGMGTLYSMLGGWIPLCLYMYTVCYPLYWSSVCYVVPSLCYVGVVYALPLPPYAMQV